MQVIIDISHNLYESVVKDYALSKLGEHELYKAVQKGTPRVQPERPKGEWIKIGDNQPYSNDDLYSCSICNRGRYTKWEYEPINFCPYCGADYER